MARNVATLLQTTGIGYNFEDYVAAFLLTCLLKDEPPFSAELGGITRIEFNKRVRGWLLDDLIVTFQHGNRLALSVKSNSQVSAAGLPAVFVNDVWEQYSLITNNPFDASKDYVGLISAPFGHEVKNALADMQRCAEVMDEARFIAEFETPSSSNAVKRQLWESVQLPLTLTNQQNFTKEDAVKLFRRLRFRQFDFLQQPSEDENKAISNCRDLLQSGNLEESKALWERLKGVAPKYRLGGGYLDLPRLLNELEFKFDLKPWPQYEQDFKAIERQTRQELQGISDHIGEGIYIAREGEIERIQKNADAHKNFAIIGESGCGKSVLTRKWAETHLSKHPILWLHGRDLARQTFNDLEAGLRLAHALEEIASATTAKCAYCVIDGVENAVGDIASKTLGAIVRTLKIGDENSRWRLILTCQSEEWLRLSPDVAKSTGLSYPIVSLLVEPPTYEEYEDLYQKYPPVRALALQKDLNTLMRRPKIADVVVTGLMEGNPIDSTDWLGEASIANWHWRTQIATGQRPGHSNRGRTRLA